MNRMRYIKVKIFQLSGEIKENKEVIDEMECILKTDCVLFLPNRRSDKWPNLTRQDKASQESRQNQKLADWLRTENRRPEDEKG